MKQQQKNRAGLKWAGADPLVIITALSTFLSGGYREWQACVISLLLLAFLVYAQKTAGKLRFPAGIAMAFSAVTLLLFLMSPLWAADKGLALFGFVKFLPLPLFCMCLGQVAPEERVKLLKAVPCTGVIHVLISAPLSLLTAMNTYLLVSGRLAGFFQYPNTFALYLLAGCIILSGSLGGERRWLKAAVFAVLLAGIVLSGSRTVFVITAVSFIVLFFKLKGNRAARIFIASVSAAAMAAVLIYAAVTKSFSGIARFLTLTSAPETLLERLLYYYDALPVILRHPLGLGYLGYFWLQGSFQTGAYTAMHVHNDFLQLLLDVGWIPAILLMIAIVRAFKKTSADRLLLAVICAHSLLDFDMQFIAMDLLLLTLLDIDGKEQPEPERIKALPVICALFAVLCLWAGAASETYYSRHYDLSLSLYPRNTQALASLLQQAKTPEEMDELADRIIALNSSCSISWSAKARAAYARGDIQDMAEYKTKALMLSRYSWDDYDDYRETLAQCAELYESSGDTASAHWCRERYKEIDDLAAEVNATTSQIYWKYLASVNN